MKKRYGLLVTIAGMFIVLPLLQIQGTTSAFGPRSLQNGDIRQSDGSSHGSELRLLQRSAPSFDHTQDYISQQLPALHPMAVVPDSELVTYRAFDGTVYSLQQYTGKYTAILMKPEDVEIYTLARLRELLDQCDLLYAYYKEILPTEPAGEGVTTIAFVKSCGYGCARLGIKGIEIDPRAVRPENVAPYPVIVHEMAHDFDQYSRAIMVGHDPPHAWTAFWESYMAFYSTGAINPDAAFEKVIDIYLNTYLKDAAATWERCVKDNACQTPLFSNPLQADVLLRVVQLFGPTIVTQWLKRVESAASLRNYDYSRMSSIDKNDLLVETLSQAVNANLVCFFDYLRWPVSDKKRAKLQRQYPDSAVCMDRDNDGYSPLEGDCDDSNPMIAPGAPEIANGVDDDCNRVLDDVLYSEAGDFPNTVSSAFQVSAPCRIRGTVSSATDFDHFQVNFPTAATVIFSTKAIGEFTGWIHYPNDTRNLFGYFIGESGRQPFTVPAGGVWNLAVAVAPPPNFSHYPTHLGSYEISVQTIVEDPNFPPIPPARVKHFNDYILTAPPLPMRFSGRSNVTARFWVSSIGWAGSVQASSSIEVPFEWIAPSGTMPESLSYRVQYYQDSLPLTGATAPAPITIEHDAVSGPVINSAMFDGRKTVTISGVRFGTAPQVIINYVDRSSTITAVSDGSITLTSKAKKLGLKSGDNSVQVYTSSGSASNVVRLRL